MPRTSSAQTQSRLSSQTSVRLPVSLDMSPCLSVHPPTTYVPTTASAMCHDERAGESESIIERMRVCGGQRGIKNADLPRLRPPRPSCPPALQFCSVLCSGLAGDWQTGKLELLASARSLARFNVVGGRKKSLVPFSLSLTKNTKTIPDHARPCQTTKRIGLDWPRGHESQRRMVSKLAKVSHRCKRPMRSPLSSPVGAPVSSLFLSLHSVFLSTPRRIKYSSHLTESLVSPRRCHQGHP